MSREFRLFLQDMRKSCQKVIRYSKRYTLKRLLADEKTFDAVMRNLEIIGEASKHVPEEFRSKHPQISWRKIAGFRDVAIHEYFGIDSTIIWDIVSHEVPDLP